MTLTSELVGYIGYANLPDNLINTILKGSEFVFHNNEDVIDFTNYPLFWSVRNDASTLLKLLLQSGFTENNEQYDYDDTYLAVDAIYFNNLRILKFLNDENLIVDGVPEYKERYEYAVKNNFRDIISFMEKRNPTLVQPVLNNGRTPIFTISNPDDVRLLVNSGYDINARDNEGFTAFHIHCINRSPTVILQALLNEGADPDILTPNGKTIWFYVGNKKKLELF